MKFDLDLQNATMYPNIQSLAINIDQRYGQKYMPNFNALNMTENDYRSFLGQLQLSLNEVKSYFNDIIFREGIPFKYANEEFYTRIAFQKDVMYFLFSPDK